MQTRPKVFYTAEATVTGGRDGHGRTSDGKLDVELRRPTEMSGTGEGTNPEQLFAVGYAACFLGALGVAAQRAGVTLPNDLRIDSRVGLGQQGDAFGIQVALTVTIPGIDREQARELVDRAHRICPYSNATRGNIAVDLSVA
jgi:Ohr subfamily peroxiredoxin